MVLYIHIMPYNPVIIELSKALIVIEKEINNYDDSYALYKEIYEVRYKRLLQLKKDIEVIIKEYNE